MCVRTKTSYGCGHSHKQDQSCHHYSCGGLERYHFQEEGDCRQCKRGGEMISRGREGQGRYGRELCKEQKPASIQLPLSTVSNTSPTSPWAPSNRREKGWRSPIRKQADKAWEEEHDRRLKDLENRSQGSMDGSVRSPEPPCHCEHIKRGDRESKIRTQIRKMEDSERIRVHRRRERQPSYDSFDSFDSFGDSYLSQGSRHHSQRNHNLEHGTHEPGSRLMDDPGFGTSKHKPYNVYNTEAYFSDLSHGLGDRVRESGRRWARR